MRVWGVSVSVNAFSNFIVWANLFYCKALYITATKYLNIYNTPVFCTRVKRIRSNEWIKRTDNFLSSWIQHNIYSSKFITCTLDLPKRRKSHTRGDTHLNSPTKQRPRQCGKKWREHPRVQTRDPSEHNLQQNPPRQYPQNNKRALQIISYKFPHSRAISGGLGGARLANSRQNSHRRAPLPFKCPRRVVPAPSSSCRKCQPVGSYRCAFTMCIKWCLYRGLEGAIGGLLIKFDPWWFYA